MAYAFSITHEGLTKYFDTPPEATPLDELRRVIAGTFGIPVNSFAIRSRDGVPGYIHRGLQGDWDLVLIPVGGNAADMQARLDVIEREHRELVALADRVRRASDYPNSSTT